MYRVVWGQALICVKWPLYSIRLHMWQQGPRTKLLVQVLVKGKASSRKLCQGSD